MKTRLHFSKVRRSDVGLALALVATFALASCRQPQPSRDNPPSGPQVEKRAGNDNPAQADQR